ncbi:methionine ABC transporter permease [Streptomyces noursei]|uniref:methionine ABC transporter permease n=1 Tax=Streptomyces noursei TaxID=1971 RepID=UPI0016778B93|nr:methionine ABC transporter permease [Streptomyces noursei]MCZ1016388.1 ABC transporter permease [Streptomyces noursei]GGX00048.1 ABC transporter permease [Streptomyces noursei]
MNWSHIQPLLFRGLVETLYMVFWSSLIAVLAGLPLGVLLVLTERGGLLQNAAVNKFLGAVVNAARALPFIVLMVALIPFTKWVTGATIGADAAIVPLAIGAIPFFARLVETSVREIDNGLVEAVQAMGGSTWTVIRKVLPESFPSLVAGITTTVVTLIGYSAMAGVLGAGGIGDLAVRYGFYRYETDVMVITIVMLIVLVTIVQLIGDLIVRSLQRRGRAAASAVRLRLLKTRRSAAAGTKGTNHAL